MKKAIFGGSFDPPHLGHLEIIKESISTLDIEELIVVPAFLNPFKSKSFAPASLRLQWLKKMTSQFPNVTVSSFEIDQNRAVPSIETVEHFKNNDEIYLIIGADNLESLSKWKDFNRLDALVTWVVATRDNTKIPDEYIKLDINQEISATSLREKMQDMFIDDSVLKEIKTFYEKGKTDG